MFHKKVTQQGQMLVIIVLIMVVGLTIGLGLFARTADDIRIAARSTESSRAFAAAEAGIEQTLAGSITTPGGTGDVAPGVSYDVAVLDQGGSGAPYPSNPSVTPRGEVFSIWLVDHDAAGNIIEVPTYTANTIDICWEAETGTPAIVATLLYKQGADYKIAYAAYDPDAATRPNGNGFDDVIDSGGGFCGDLNYRKVVDFTNFGDVASGINPAVDTLLVLRLMPVFVDARIAVDPNNSTSFPVQGKEIVSEGSTGTVVRTVQVVQSLSSLSSLFDTALYSTSGNLVK